MPELPEVETIRTQLEKSVVGRGIAEVRVFTDKMVHVGPGKIAAIKKGSKEKTAQFTQILAGKAVVSVARRAKYLIILLSEGVGILIHLRMSGQLIFIPKEDLEKPLKLSLAKTALSQVLPTKHTHVAFIFTDGSILFYNDTRQFGHLRVVTEAELNTVTKDANLGPEPLELSLEEFKKIVMTYPKKRAKDFLLSQSVIAGIGNIYADEALFLSQILPSRKIGDLDQGEIKSLYNSIQMVLTEAIQAGGSSIEYFLMTNGDSGKFVTKHQVYGRGGEPCVNCGEKLSSIKIASRTTVFCKNCQK